MLLDSWPVEVVCSVKNIEFLVGFVYYWEIGFLWDNVFFCDVAFIGEIGNFEDNALVFIGDF